MSKAEWIASSPTGVDLPRLGVREVAVFGRSNVGKSSLLNAVAQSKIARISKTPGRTRLFHLFRVRDRARDVALIDLPGYGFADVPKAVRARWHEAIGRFVRERTSLHTVVLLLDSRRVPVDEDAEILDFLADGDRVRTLVVATKIDLINKAARKPTVAQMAKTLGVDPTQILPVSAHAGDGLFTLREEIWRPAET